MPVATPETYAAMLDKAKSESFAFPAINVSSSQTLNAALAGFAEAESDGIIQVSTGGADYFSGPTVKNMVSGSLGFAAFAHEVAKKYPINVALHTDHCPKDKLDGFVRPLIEASTERVKGGGLPYFQSHMWDGSAVPLEENLVIAQELLAKAAAAHIILEVEIGVVGGEEDGVEGGMGEHLYTTPEDALATVEALGLGEKGRYLTALTFGNVHGVMNVDTDTQYAFTRPVVDHMLRNYDGVLKVDGEVGNKKAYDPRAWGKAAEAGMSARVVEACQNLRSAGTTL